MIAACRKMETPLPEPRTVETYSGQTRLRLSKSLHRQAVAMAEAEEVSLNQYIVDALVAKIAGEQVGSKTLREVKQQLKEIQRTVAAAAVSRSEDSYYVNGRGQRATKRAVKK